MLKVQCLIKKPWIRVGNPWIQKLISQVLVLKQRYFFNIVHFNPNTNAVRVIEINEIDLLNPRYTKHKNVKMAALFATKQNYDLLANTTKKINFNIKNIRWKTDGHRKIHKYCDISILVCINKPHRKRFVETQPNKRCFTNRLGRY